jgi:hypothetical protein
VCACTVSPRLDQLIGFYAQEDTCIRIHGQEERCIQEETCIGIRVSAPPCTPDSPHPPSHTSKRISEAQAAAGLGIGGGGEGSRSGGGMDCVGRRPLIAQPDIACVESQESALEHVPRESPLCEENSSCAPTPATSSAGTHCNCFPSTTVQILTLLLHQQLLRLPRPLPPRSWYCSSFSTCVINEILDSLVTVTVTVRELIETE